MESAAPAPSHSSNASFRLVPFALAGVAVFGVVLDEIDVPHDNAQSVAILAAGAVFGLVVGLIVGRHGATGDRATRGPQLAWDIVRFFLAFEMVRYGMAKVVGMQFYPQYWRLDLRPADLRPMSLAWVFFGRTYGYQLIAGLIEVGSGILVCFRRTTLLGACLMATALSQVVLVNFFYDVPVKLFASVYLTMDVCLIARDGPRLLAFFLPPSDDAPSSRRTRWLRAAAIVLVLALPTAEIVHQAFQHRVFHMDVLEGAYSVERRAGLDDLLPEAPGAWDRVYFEKGDFGFVRVGKERIPFHTEVNEAEGTLKLSNLGGRASAILQGTFTCASDRVRFEGSRAGQPFSIDLTRDLPR